MHTIGMHLDALYLLAISNLVCNGMQMVNINAYRELYIIINELWYVFMAYAFVRNVCKALRGAGSPAKSPLSDFDTACPGSNRPTGLRQRPALSSNR